jgi:hypothetical protein
VIRAIRLSITWDEAYSYLEFVRNGIVFPERYVKMSANDHFLNTGAMIFFSKIFGASEFVLRIPNLIAHLLFLYFSGRLVKHFETTALIIFSFLIINVNPYLLDFFSLARGYGISFGLMMGSIYYLFCFLTKEKKNTNAILSLLFAGLSVFANLVMLNYFIVFSGIITIAFFILPNAYGKKTKLLSKEMIAALLIVAIVLGIILPITLKLKSAGALFLGEQAGFWQTTVVSVIERSFYEHGYFRWIQLPALFIVCGFVVIAFIVFINAVIKKERSPIALFFISLFLLLILCSFSTVVEHIVFGTPFLMDRSALYLLILFCLLSVFLLNELSKTRRGISLITVFFGILIGIHFLISANVNYSLEWKYDADTKKMLSELDRLNAVKGKTISLGIPVIVDPCIRFYKETKGYGWINEMWWNPNSGNDPDYLFLPPQVVQKTNLVSREIIMQYPVTGNMLLGHSAKDEVPSRHP